MVRLDVIMIPQLKEVGFGLLGCDLWKLSTSSSACLTFPRGSQEFSASENPFHLTKYSMYCPFLRLSRMVSTSNSSSPSIRSGGGGISFGCILKGGSMKGLSSFSLNTSCFHRQVGFCGSLSL